MAEWTELRPLFNPTFASYFQRVMAILQILPLLNGRKPVHFSCDNLYYICL
jgi:hypothetical protein